MAVLTVISLYRSLLLCLIFLLVITEEDLDWQPSITTNLESRLHAVDSLHLVISQLLSIQSKVLLNASLGDGLGDNRGFALKTPEQQALLDTQTLLLSKVEKSLVLVEW